ncbi:MAG: RNA methyltransferase [Elusimicrobia bacterium]|nr:RNA methyltransferase [Elusimicrobiota bacterium]
MNREAIASPQNAKIKELIKVRQRRNRDRQKKYIIDGVRQLKTAFRNDFRLEALYFSEHSADAELLELARKRAVALQPVTARVFEKIGYGDNPDGHLGLAVQAELGLEDMPCPEDALYVIAERLEKPGNLGAILRSADAAGVTGVIVCDTHTDVYNPNVIRSSLGAFFTVPLAVAGSEETAKWLKDRDVSIYAAAPDAEKSYTGIDLTRAAALAVGSEHSGLSAVWMKEQRVSIPMTGQVDSLNAAQTATILMFEAARQRRDK